MTSHSNRDFLSNIDIQIPNYEEGNTIFSTNPVPTTAPAARAQTVHTGMMQQCKSDYTMEVPKIQYRDEEATSEEDDDDLDTELLNIHLK